MRLRPLAFVFSLLFIASSIRSQTVTLRQVGKSNFFLTTPGYFNWRGALYTVDNQRSIYKTDLDSGVHTRIGKATYPMAKFFFGLNTKLYIVDNDGSMTEIDPISGDWKNVSAIGEWAPMDRVFVVANSLYSIQNGGLYYHRSTSATNRTQRGGNDFFTPGSFIRADNRLYTLIRDGNLYEINMGTGEWKSINKAKNWKNLKAAQVLGDKFYSVDVSGALSVFSFADKTEKVLDKTQFERARLMFAEAGRLYVIMNDGNLYEVKISE